MKNFLKSWISIVVLILLVNTQQYWSYELGITGTVWLIGFLIYLALAVVALVFLIKTIREKFTNRDRNIVLGGIVATLIFVYIWPDGIFPGTTPTDKFERFVQQETDLDLHGYSYSIVKDSLEVDDFFPDYYYELAVQYDSSNFNAIVSKIRKTAFFDQLQQYDHNLRQDWDSLNIGTRKGIWDETDEYYIFIPEPSRDKNERVNGFFMMLDKKKRQAVIMFVQT